jgi:hydroxyethylthiazole kinase
MDIAAETWRVLSAVRARAPRVHCITNDAAQAFTADVLLAVGAVPSLTLAEAELADFVNSASALLVNLGTLDPRRSRAIDIAVPAAGRAGLPWVLDPVFVDRSPVRLDIAAALLAAGPAVVRGNRAECGALLGEVLEAGAVPSRPLDPVLAVTGAVDLAIDAERVAEISNGHAYMGQATAIGCALSSLVAACLAVEDDAWLAAIAAMVAWGVAGEVAGDRAGGPGTFRPLLLDAVHGLDARTLQTRARVKERTL